jgi:hypothetical protein
MLAGFASGMSPSSRPLRQQSSMAEHTGAFTSLNKCHHYTATPWVDKADSGFRTTASSAFCRCQCQCCLSFMYDDMELSSWDPIIVGGSSALLSEDMRVSTQHCPPSTIHTYVICEGQVNFHITSSKKGKRPATNTMLYSVGRHVRS